MEKFVLKKNISRLEVEIQGLPYDSIKKYGVFHLDDENVIRKGDDNLNHSRVVSKIRYKNEYGNDLEVVLDVNAFHNLFVIYR